MASTEPIAIIGTGCRFPGGASSPSKLWELLQEPRDLASKPPASRFNAEAFYQGGKPRPGTINAPEAYFLEEDVQAFDTSFFNISPPEAASMDPQQRFLLEVVYEALERAGLPIERLQGSPTGVFAGSMNLDYYKLLCSDVNALPPFMLTGTTPSMLATRVSYFFDFHGPSLVTDTACSSSLTALHLAVESLHKGDCSLAIATGSCLIVSPDDAIVSSSVSMLSPSGRSHMWDDRADGYARGEGVAAVVLKPLSQALKDGDAIESVIRATGIGCDGRTNSLTMPNGEAQRSLIRSTYARAGLNPLLAKDRCQYFEAHGTGTPAGDPQEASGIAGAFFDEQTAPEDIMFAGSIKSVVGHTEGAAGIAGVIKASLALKHATIPPNLLHSKPSPRVAPYLNHLRVPLKAQPWPVVAPGSPRRASVNSFGLGGANAHAILESLDSDSNSVGTVDDARPITLPFVFSASSVSCLRTMLQQYMDYLDQHPDVNLVNLAASLINRRSVLAHRVVFTAESVPDLKSKLKAALKEHASTGQLPTITSRRLAPRRRKILGVFTGQGAQWPQMGLDVICKCSQAAIWFHELQESLEALPPEYRPNFTLLDELSKPETTSRLSTAEISLPLRTALQIVQVNILKSVGVEFTAVVGHSSGEIAAAYAAGWLTAVDAIRVAYLRGLAAKNAGSPGQTGRMLAVGISWDQAQAICSEAPYSGRVVVAASNSPSSVTLSGDEELISELEWLFASLDQSPRRLKVDTAYHSHHMAPCAGPYLDAMQACDVGGSQGTVKTKWFSSVYDGKPMSTLEAKYWSENMLRPVQFSQALSAASAAIPDLDAIIEVGPHPALKGPSLQTLSSLVAEHAELPYLSLSHRSISGVESLANGLGSMWAYLGAEAIDFQSFIRIHSPSRTLQYISDLPSYSFDHSKTHWAVPQLSAARIHRKQPRHSLLGVICPERGEGEWRWRNYMRLEDLEWLHGHRIQSQIVLPATSFLIMALEAAHVMAEDRSIMLVDVHDLVIQHAISIPDDSVGIETLFIVSEIKFESDRSMATFSCQKVSNGTFTCCASGRLEVTFGEPESMLLSPHDPVTSGLRAVNSEHFYAELDKLGYGYSDLFRSLQNISRRRGVAHGSIPAPPATQDSDLLMHPAALDTGLQAFMAAIAHPGDTQLSTLYLPVRLNRTTFNPAVVRRSAQGNIDVEATVSQTMKNGLSGDIELFDSEGRGMVQIEGLQIQPLTQLSLDDWPMFAQEAWGPLNPTASLSTALGTQDLHSDRHLADRLSLLYLRDAALQLTPAERRNLDWHRAQYVAWMDNALNRVREGTHPDYSPKDLEGDLSSTLSSELGSAGIAVRAVDIVGKSLMGWLRGEADIMEELRRDSFLTRFYKEVHDLQVLTRNLAGLVEQLAFRHPRMKILEVGAGTGSATRQVLKRIKRAYHSYTFTDISAAFFQDAEEAFAAHQDRFEYKVMDLERDPTEQGFAEHQYDLVIACNVLHATRSLGQTMTNVRRTLKPGGRVVILETTNPDMIAYHFIFGGFQGWWLGELDDRSCGPMLSCERWDDLLKATGFAGIETISPFEEGQLFGQSVFTARAVDDQIQQIEAPLAVQARGQHRDLILLGGATAATDKLVTAVRHTLSPFFARITQASSIETSMLPTNASLAVVLVLSDLDAPCLQGISVDRLRRLQAVLEVTGKLLWVSMGNVNEEPYLRMSKGLLRTLSLEKPHAQIQYLNVRDPTDLSPDLLATTLMRLVHTNMESDFSLAQATENPEWELLLEDGIMKIPRMRASRAMNQRWTSSRGFTSRDTVTPQETSVGVHSLESKDETGLSFELRTKDKPFCADKSDVARQHWTPIRVHHASLAAVPMGDGYLHLVSGHNEQTRAQIVAATINNASFTSTPPSWCIDVPPGLPEGSEAAFVGDMCSALVAQHILDSVSPGSHVLIHECPKDVKDCLSYFASTMDIKLHFSTTRRTLAGGSDMLIFPPQSSSRAIARLLPRGVSALATFAFEKEDVVARIRAALPPQLPYLGRDSFYRASSFLEAPNSPDQHRLKEAYEYAERRMTCSSAHETLSPDKLTDCVSPGDGLQIVDWQRSPALPVSTASATSLVNLSADKTYLLVGLTGDLGLSVCHWMITRGARSLVLTSRNPRVDPAWLAEMKSLGASVTVLNMDVTDLTSVCEVHAYMRLNLPAVGGVVNGAMVLRDAPFQDLSLADVLRVFAPKIEGSRNLESMYDDNNLDFFILMGSVAGVGGNYNQAAYAAATEFMAGLIHQRRRRGAVGSIIHPGQVRGVGYIAGLDAGMQSVLADTIGPLELSEGDLLELFAEAILAGRPDSGRDPEIMAGYRLADPAEHPNVLWYRNPKYWPFIHHFRQSAVTEQGSREEEVPIKTQLLTVDNSTSAAEVVANGFRTKLRRKLHLPGDSGLPGSMMLTEVGVDSLTAVDLRTWFVKELGVDVPVLQLLGGSSIDALASEAAGKLDPMLVPQLKPMEVPN
ncbi:ketoacyl-synt-domain-containing protein [Aspergillus homomorphus CBS 101889]|uniref:Ketoacyl-synt-domain-containing protein n=1 Tax=Aspergillus homomorphus (strain CBS 101889) TaxID=1450537 RepID=A0A395HHJ4_ASPHC|nr:ketoacyl-synt-domain-containing protein [Aspergillus homomorphus CBS 101889]RAL07361.1 ketoacyl-synt-domain-containing protein [Aspergillus homomorphus CBS 101889]